jgi:anti-sigma B factor antagonist
MLSTLTMDSVLPTHPAAVVVSLDGELDLHESPRVKDKLHPALNAQAPSVVIDLREVTYIDSSGLALFIETLQRIQAYGGKLALCGLRPSVQSIFEIARLDQIFKIYPDQASALAA